MLNITNGQSANEVLSAAGIPGSFLGWDDPMHQGPAPSGLSLREMSRIRARFIAGNQWESLEASQKRFEDRDHKLRVAARTSSVLIWSSFELFDQLHLLQLLDWFEQHRDACEPPRVLWVRAYLGGGQLDADDLRNLYNECEPISAPQQCTAADIWEAFTSANPDRLFAWSRRSLAGLPFMQKALRRLLEEFPSSECGLSRTERQIIEVLEAGALAAVQLFQACQALEVRRFMGDSSFWLELQRLIDADQPLVCEARGAQSRFPPTIDQQSREFLDQRFALTDQGLAVLAGEQDFLSSWSGERWIGGSRIHVDCPWRWDNTAEHLQATSR